MSWRIVIALAFTFSTGCAAQEVITLREALWRLTELESSREAGWQMMMEADDTGDDVDPDAVTPAPDSTDGSDDSTTSSPSMFGSFMNLTNSSNASNLSTPMIKHIQAITQLIVAPIALFVGQDVEQLLHVMNGLLVGGISGLMTQLGSIDKLDPMTIVNVFGMLTAASGSIAATLQNPAAGSRIQGGVIFKQVSSIAVTTFYFKAMNKLGGCEGISHEETSVYPHGVPENCTVQVDIPYYGLFEGKELALWVMTGFEYGLVAGGAMVAPYLAMFMCIFNAASLGGHMLIRSFIHVSTFSMIYFGYSEKQVKGFKTWVSGLSGKGFIYLVGAGFIVQFLCRMFRHKDAGQGPFTHIRFRATEARGGGTAWASISELKLLFHREQLEIPDSFSDPPKEGETMWKVTFPKAVNLTEFCFMSGDKESNKDNDPVSWFLEASMKEGDEPPPDDDPSWVIIHEAKQEKVPKARNAKSEIFMCTAPKGGDAAAVAAASAAQAEAMKAASAETGALGRAKEDVEAGLKKAQEMEQAAMGRLKRGIEKMKTGFVKAKDTTVRVTNQAKEKAVEVRDTVKQKTTMIQKIVGAVKGKSKTLVQSFMVPFSVGNHMVRELTDQTSGKDKKSRQQIVMEALHSVGWDEPLLKKVMKQTLQMLLKKFEVKDLQEIIEKIVESCHLEELQAFAQHATNMRLGDFVKDMEDVLRKMIEEEEKEFEAKIKPIKDHLDIALREFYMGEAAIVISKAFYTTALEARMYLMTLQDVTNFEDGSVLLQGHFKDLDPKMEKHDIKALNEYLEKVASGHAFPGRTQHVAKMKKWLEADKKIIEEFLKKEMGSLGKIMAKAQPIINQYPKALKNYTMLKKDPKGQLMQYAEPVKKQALAYAGTLQKKLTDKVKSKVADVEKQAMDKVADVEKQAMDKVGDVEKQAKEAAAGAASSAAAAAGGVDIEAAASAAKKLVPEGKHSAPPEGESETPYVAMADPPAHSTDTAEHDAFAAMVEKQANHDMCVEEMHKKLGLTLEEAKRITSHMTEADRAHAAACGGVTLPEVMKLAERFGVHFNKEKAAETQKLVQAFKVQKELAKEAPPFERKKAAKKAANMTPADISDRMAKPPTARPKASAADMKKVVKGLKTNLANEQDKVADGLEKIRIKTEELAAESARLAEEQKKLQETEQKLAETAEKLLAAETELGESAAELESTKRTLDEARKAAEAAAAAAAAAAAEPPEPVDMGAEWKMDQVDEKWYRLYNRAEPDRALHIQDGPLVAGPVEPNWWSAMWTGDESPGEGYFRITNRWKESEGVVIHIENGSLQASKAEPGWLSAMWTAKPGGDGCAKFVNKWKPEVKLHVQDLERVAPMYEFVAGQPVVLIEDTTFTSGGALPAGHPAVVTKVPGDAPGSSAEVRYEALGEQGPILQDVMRGKVKAAENEKSVYISQLNGAYMTVQGSDMKIFPAEGGPATAVLRNVQEPKFMGKFPWGEFEMEKVGNDWQELGGGQALWKWQGQ